MEAATQMAKMQPAAIQIDARSKLNKLDETLGSLPDGSQRSVVNFGNVFTEFLHKNHLLSFLFALGFEETDLLLVYLKMDFNAEEPKYAWVAFANHQLALRAGALAEARGLEVAWVRDELQSVASLKEHFKTNAMMHPSVRGDLRPCFYEDGKEVPFRQPDVKKEKEKEKKPERSVFEEMQRFLQKHFPNGPPGLEKKAAATGRSDATRGS